MPENAFDNGNAMMSKNIHSFALSKFIDIDQELSQQINQYKW